MKLTKFQVKNYKSIIDSKICHLAELVTILAGKNESGKSSLLEALYDLNLDKDVNEKAIPIKDSSQIPEITAWLTTSKNEVQEMLATCDIPTPKKLPQSFEIKVTKTYPRSYHVESELLDSIKDPDPIETAEQLSKEFETIIEPAARESFRIHGRPAPAFDTNNLMKFKTEFVQWKNSLTGPHYGNVAQATNKISIQSEIESFYSKIQTFDPKVSFKELLSEQILEYLPNIILFDSFNDVFPNEIPINDLATNQWIKDLEQISNLDVSIIQGSNARNKITHKSKINTELNKNFRKFWSQDLSDLHVDYNDSKLNFWIKEDDVFYEPEIRSQGRRWHLAFYIKVTARAKENVNNVILIDEPGLYLHANAQRDILLSLEDCAKEAPIIFSTHSPYLIEADKLERVRLVQKNSTKGTFVENKIHKVSDKETLTPILTAIGLELNRGIIGVERLNNVVVEGISDYYYLNAFKNILNRNSLNFIHGGSSGNMPKIGTILQGWGCKVVYLFDNDKAFEDAKTHIKSEWLAITEDLLTKIPVEGAIEDMFETTDFATHILEIEPRKHSVKNSEAVKKVDKVLKSKNFREKILVNPSINLDDSTLSNFNSLFDELERILNS